MATNQFFFFYRNCCPASCPHDMSITNELLMCVIKTSSGPHCHYNQNQNQKRNLFDTYNSEINHSCANTIMGGFEYVTKNMYIDVTIIGQGTPTEIMLVTKT